MAKRSYKKIFKYLVLILVITFLIPYSASADYSFEIPEAQTTVQIESDGSMTVFVEYKIKNLGQKLDYIDIGLPNNNYSLSDIQVTLNGEQNSSIKVVKADYEATGLRYGISLEMGAASIPSGESAVVDVWIPNLKQNLFEASSETINEETVEFAGFQFSPNYFNSKFTSGTTKYSFIIVFPLGVEDGYAYYYSPEKWAGEEKPEAWLDEDDCVVYEWYSEKADMHTAYTFGGKFIKSALTSTANITKSSGGEGTASSIITWESVIITLSCILIPVILIIAAVKKIIKSGSETTKKNSKNYFPPQVKTDGEGIKRGLTAVEAAVLLEIDLDRVISMILYGLAKKNVLEVKSMDPLDVEIVDPLPEELNEYELNFIDALKESNKSRQTSKMRDAMHRLILSVSKKVEGFSLAETKEYYKSICEKAWSQVEAAETPELKSELLGENFGWAMLEDDPEKKVTDTFTDEVFYPPSWWWRVSPRYRRTPHYPTYDSSPSSSSSSEKRSGGSSSTPTPMPVLPGAMFARSITDGARKLANSLVGNPKTFNASVKNRTNPDPVYSSSSSSHRHGGGSGRSSCACACACDSCACACAGGGR